MHQSWVRALGLSLLQCRITEGIHGKRYETGTPFPLKHPWTNQRTSSTKPLWTPWLVARCCKICQCHVLTYGKVSTLEPAPFCESKSTVIQRGAKKRFKLSELPLLPSRQKRDHITWSFTFSSLKPSRLAVAIAIQAMKCLAQWFEAGLLEVGQAHQLITAMKIAQLGWFSSVFVDRFFHWFISRFGRFGGGGWMADLFRLNASDGWLKLRQGSLELHHGLSNGGWPQVGWWFSTHGVHTCPRSKIFMNLCRFRESRLF